MTPTVAVQQNSKHTASVKDTEKGFEFLLSATQKLSYKPLSQSF